MSVFVGFDPDRLAALRRAMVTAHDDLRAITLRHRDALRVDDELARLLAPVADLGRALEQTWIPLVERILLCDALGPRRGADWLRAPDPTLPPMTSAEARALARRLLDTSGDTGPVDDILVQLARVAADPLAAAAFRHALDRLGGWTAVVDRIGLAHLGTSHLLVDDPTSAVLQRRLRLLDDAAALLAVLAQGRPDGHRPWRPAVLDGAEPYAAALVARHLRLDPRVLAETADRILLRAYEGRPDGDRYRDGYLSGPNAGDVLFARLVDDPAAATEFLRRAAAHPAVVFMSAQDQQLVRRLLLVGTAPPRVDAGRAGAILPPLLNWAGEARRRPLPHDGGTPDASAFLAEASAPWLLQFGRRAPEWQWTAMQGDRALRTLVDDGRAMDHLVGALGRWRSAMVATPLTRSDGRVDLDVLLDLSTMFAQFELAFRDEAIADDAAERFWVEVTLFAGTLVASAVVSGGFLVSVGTDLALDAGSATAAAALGRFGVATSATRSEREARARFGTRGAEVAVIAVVAVVAREIEAGRLPRGTLELLQLPRPGHECTLSAVQSALDGFVSRLAPIADPAVFNAIAAVMAAFVNPSSARQACG